MTASAYRKNLFHFEHSINNKCSGMVLRFYSQSLRDVFKYGVISSPNTGKYGPETTLNTFNAVSVI